MKVYISADIEGVTGTVSWEDTGGSGADYGTYREQMTAEVAAACEGTLNAGADEVWVKDSHGAGRNLLPAKLPKEVKLIRGRRGHPFMMVEGLDGSFDALMMVGFHSRAGSDANPLAHTVSGSASHIRINDRYASEMLMHTYAAATVSVPLVFLSGDQGLCDDVASLNPNIGTVAVKEGVGELAITIHPELAVERIREGAEAAIEGDPSACAIELPDHFEVEVRYKEHMTARRMSFYPGASLKEPFVLRFETDDYFEVLRLLMFVL
ncbi:MAG: M55 family metallopeptidase [Candidatus Latescibacteria bacterium]|jgi:D-amino peptidase|nr:M55 family metallopeptidase [Candidatus Latescibacterota bacterium]